MINITMDYNLGKLSKYSEAFKLGGELQTHMDKMILEGITPYVPYDKGVLSTSAIASSNPGSGLITWNSPYAKVVWYGKTKHGNNMEFNRDFNKLAGPMWIERYKADNSELLRQEVIKKVKKI